MRAHCSPRWLLAAVALAFCCAALPTARAIKEPPYGPNDPAWAYVQMQIVDISKIDGVEQAFAADFYMLTTWAAPNDDSPLTVNDDLTKELLDQHYWSPRLEFINARSEMTRLVDEPFGFVEEPLFDLAAIRPGYTLPPGWVWSGTHETNMSGHMRT